MYSTRSKRKPKRRPSATSRSAGSVIERSNTNARQGHEMSGIPQKKFKAKNNSKRIIKNEKEHPAFTRGSDNVFEDLGFDREEAANLKVRADLMIDLREYIRDRGWTQAEAADFFGETQPRISNLLKGEISRFSIDKLINMLARAGLRVRLETKPRAA